MSLGQKPILSYEISSSSRVRSGSCRGEQWNGRVPAPGGIPWLKQNGVSLRVQTPMQPIGVSGLSNGDL